MRRRLTEQERAQYVHRLASLEKYVVLPARIALIVSWVAFLWQIIVGSVGAKDFSSLFKWTILVYALLTILYSLYVFRLAPRIHNLAITKSVVFTSAMTDNLFLGVILYGVMLEPLGAPWHDALPEASLFWVYCALVVRNTFMFPSVSLQTAANGLYIVGYVTAILFNIWGRDNQQLLSDAAQRELVFRSIMLALVSICGSAIYALRERKLREMDEAQERTIRSLRLDIAGMLAAQVAHELKNPLSIMTNAAFLLRRSNPDLAPQATQQVEIIEDEIKRADHIITELLDYAKLSEGRIESVLVNDCIDDSIGDLKHEFEARAIHIKRHYSLDMPYLFIDPRQLRQVFTNILLNACEAIEKTGTVSITTTYSTDGFIELSISDTGKGMPPEVLSSIFKPLFTTKEKGTGMGLSIVHNVVRAYKGAITAESQPGRGTTFHLRFPTRMALRMQEERPSPPSAGPELKSAVGRAQA